MNSFHTRSVGFLLWLVACGCQAPAPLSPAESEPAENDQSVRTVQARIHADLPAFSFTLVGQPEEQAAEVIQVTKIEVRRGSELEPVQVIDNLETETPFTEHFRGFEVLDMNFDGYGDIRIVEFQPPGPNLPYLNWLFDPADQRFVASPELNNISSPKFDIGTRRIHSEWRDGAARYGTDSFEVIEGKPVLTRKEVREYSEPGVYERTVSRSIDGQWQIIEREQIRE